MRRTIGRTAGLLSVAALLALTLSVGTASAAPKKVTAVTHTSDHPDTTSVSGPCTVSSPNGPAWADDNLSLRLTVTPGTGAGEYAVTIDAHGSFSAFANPNDGSCYTGHGGVDGWYDLTVQSPTPPDPANLPSHVDGSVTQGAIVAMLFDGHATSIVGGHYEYTYKLVAGSKYTQVG